ncbi:UDP-N-acetylmuramate--alanine ligase [Catalinimonas alkaloidigena]|uniref:UDP-N-acetylmuramate--L-alanine ligase n=1 Tax=Catalinimonas alkaloidigena TaxID=1075417 RepID=A0A1G9J9L7_9BACT|nr:UDP-N-acetylmuramate--L-alanine ligase [Catalinimonas alkaloidigena]SDL34249.1 UDP-N-acetylmuramate--alanine ligase [Catalinimonas alkaloidigena]
MQLDRFHTIYLIGIGGIGMSALARYFRAAGRRVSGYDRTETPLTKALVQEGIAVHYEDRVEAMGDEVLQHREETLVVYTPAVPTNHQELTFLREEGFEVQKRSTVLGWITEDHVTVAVAGTHGKTTTSSMVAHLLTANGRNCTAFLGGITQNYNTNLLLGEAARPDHIVVVEADEYDRSFLTLRPNVAVVTSADADHLDIYGDAAAIRESFELFIQRIVPGGHLMLREGLPLSVPAGLQVQQYGLDAQHNCVEHVRIEAGRYVFNLKLGEERIEDVQMRTQGLHNAENALAAALVARQLGLSLDEIRQALNSFRGVRRRFEYIFESDEAVYLDDYAHHPTEIEAALASVRQLYPDKKLTLLFQPHLFSRTRDFAEEFARALQKADQLLLLPIYPAREKPMEGVSSEWLLSLMEVAGGQVLSKIEALDYISAHRPELLITMGAGDIDQLVEKIRNIYWEEHGFPATNAG